MCGRPVRYTGATKCTLHSAANSTAGAYPLPAPPAWLPPDGAAPPPPAPQPWSTPAPAWGPPSAPYAPYPPYAPYVANAPYGVFPPPPAKGRGVLKGVLIALGGVAVLIVALVVVVSAVGSNQRAATAAYAHGQGGSTFTSPQGRFTAVFPAVPSRHVTSSNAGGIQINDITYFARSSLHDEAEVDYAALPAAIPDSRMPDLLPGVLNSMAAKLNGQVVSSAPMTYLGLPALEGVIKRPDGDFVKARIFVSGHIAYVVGAQGTAENPQTYDRLVSSFHLTA